jgi:hypothetical protein
MATEVIITGTRPCDICPVGADTVAAYDGKTRMGPWANMCEKHWATHGVGRLGTGYGQKLVTKETAK